MSYLCHVYLIMRSVNWGEEDPMQQPRTLIFHIINNDLEKGENKPWSLSPDLFSLQATERAAPRRPWSPVSPFRLLAAVQTQVLRATTTPPTTPCVIDDCRFPWASYNISSSNVPWRKCAIIHHAITVPNPNSNFVPSNFIMVEHFRLPVCFYNGGEHILYSSETTTLKSGWDNITFLWFKKYIDLLNIL